MSQLTRRIREREAAIGVDRRTMAAAVSGLRAGVRHRMSAPSTLCAVFGGGLVLGWVSGGRGSSRAVSAEPSHAGTSRIASAAMHLAREVLWPLGVSVMREQLDRLLAGGGAQSR